MLGSRVVLLTLSAVLSATAAGAEWTPVTVPATDAATAAAQSPAWYRCFIRVPANMTSRNAEDLHSDSVTLSLADIRGAFAVYLNGQKIAEGDGLPDEPRKRVKVPKGILENGKFNVLAVRMDAKASAAGMRRAPILAGYFDELVVEGQWERHVGGDVEPESLKPLAKQPAVAAYTEAGFRKQSTPLAANPELMHGRKLSPAESLATMTTPDDVTVELVAQEPAVAQPTHISFDERGRMWVAQYRQYPYPAGVKMISRDMYYRARFNKVPPTPPKHDRGADVISVHEDTDGDGTFDKSKVVLDGLNMANAALRGHGGIWVMHSPYLMFYPDADGDDVPDRDPEVRLAGFGLEDTHSASNGLVWGPDGWLYGVTGSGITCRIVRPGVDPPNVPGEYVEGCMVWRYHPETKAYEVFAEGGGNNFGLDFDADGRLFSGDNGDETRGWHFVQSGIYAKSTTPVPAKYGPPRNPFAFGILTKMATSNAIPRFTHATVVFEGTGLPSRYVGQVIGANPLLRKLIAAQRRFVGSTVATTDTDIPLAASDIAFRPVCVTSGADGALYVGDFYEEFIAHGQHYQSQIDPTSGRIYRLRGKLQRPERDVNLAGKTTAQLIETLTHRNRWHRHTAVRLLGERRDASAAGPLKALLQKPDTRPALEALWALHQMGALDDATTRLALAHPAAPVRAWAIRLAGDAKRLTPDVLGDVVKYTATESDPGVRSQVASTAKRLPAEQALALTAAVLRRDADAADAFVPMLCWWTIESHCDAARDAVLALLKDPAAWESRMTRQTILPRLMRRFATKGTHADFLACAALLRAAPSTDHRKQLMTGFEEAFSGRALPPLPAELASTLAESGHASAALRVRLGEPEAIAAALKVVDDPQAGAAERLTMITLFGEVKTPEAVEPLLAVARDEPKADLSKAALSSLMLYEDDAIGTRVAGIYARLPAAARPAALNLLASRPAWSAALLGLVEGGTVKRADVPPDIVARLKTDSDERLNAKADTLFPAPPPTGPEAKRVAIDRVRRIIDAAPGDPYKGEPIFMQRCASCHTLFFKGGQIGPNLTPYQREDLGTMLPSILDPNVELREGFESHLLRTKDGRVLGGFLVENDAAVVVIRGTDGQDVRVPRDRVDRLKPTGTSLMPEGLLDGLDDQQLRDFFAYLRIPQPITQ